MTYYGGADDNAEEAKVGLSGRDTPLSRELDRIEKAIAEHGATVGAITGRFDAILQPGPELAMKAQTVPSENGVSDLTKRLRSFANHIEDNNRRLASVLERADI